MTATLDRYMTRHPHSIRVDENLENAAALMSNLGVHHLPVVEGGRLVGVLSDRDVRVADAAKKRVRDLYIDEPYAVDVDTSLFVVAAMVAQKHIGSTVVLEDGKLAGIFTATDACRALADALGPSERY